MDAVPVDKRLIRQVLGGARVAWGVAALISPRANMGLLGIPPGDNADGHYLSRLFATREITVGALSSGIAGQEVAVTACRAAVVVDTVDVLSLWLARKRQSPAALAALTVLGIAAVAVGALVAED